MINLKDLEFICLIFFFLTVKIINLKLLLICNMFYNLLYVKVPKEWKLDDCYEEEPKDPLQMGHRMQYPSKWRAATSDPESMPQIVDHFIIPRTS